LLPVDWAGLRSLSSSYGSLDRRHCAGELRFLFVK
jgi:hypothetical protein